MYNPYESYLKGLQNVRMNIIRKIIFARNPLSYPPHVPQSTQKMFKICNPIVELANTTTRWISAHLHHPHFASSLRA
jgi:hypothetical protein